jgi:hypothetical protein
MFGETITRFLPWASNVRRFLPMLQSSTQHYATKAMYSLKDNITVCINAFTMMYKDKDTSPSSAYTSTLMMLMLSYNLEPLRVFFLCFT